MLTPYEGREAAGSALQWRERGDGHWYAAALGGHYELVPDDGRWKAWWRPSQGPAVDLGTHGTLGGATMAAKRHADAEGRMAAEDCSHAHPAGVPTTPCPDPSAHGHHHHGAAAAVTTVVAAREDRVWRKTRDYHMTKRRGHVEQWQTRYGDSLYEINHYSAWKTYELFVMRHDSGNWDHLGTFQTRKQAERGAALHAEGKGPKAKRARRKK